MMNKPNLDLTPEQFARHERQRLNLELSKCEREISQCKREVAQTLQAHRLTKLTYRSIVIALVLLNVITYGAMLYVKYSQAQFM
ncbi:hypothetical protein ACG9HZ_04650 [Acinetobacter defluvii]